MKKKIAPFCLLVILFLAGCGNNAVLDQTAASDLVGDHLKTKPVYESKNLTLGEIKFKNNKDKIDLEKFKELEDKGFLEMKLINQKKRFLSKDSVYVYEISLTDKSKPYILKQEGNKAVIKVLSYDLDENKPPTLDKSGNKKATLTVMLKKVKNAFTILYEDKNAGSNFITKTYKLKYEKDQGWAVAED